MSLIDKLREIENFTPSHSPVAAELAEIVGKLIAYVEHGDDFIRAAEDDVQAREAGEPANKVNELLSPPPPAEPDVPSAAAPPAATSPDAPAVGSGSAPGQAATAEDKDAEIASLRQQVANLIANQERTQAEVTPTGPEPAPPAAPAGEGLI